MLEAPAKRPITSLAVVRPKSGPGAAAFPLLQAINAHQAVLTRDCVVRGCERDAEPGSRFCSWCAEALRHGERPSLYPFDEPTAPRNGKHGPHETMAPTRTELTPAEIEILRLSSEGLTNAQIAAARFTSIETVKTQKRRLFQALEAKNIWHAVAIGFRRGVLA